MFRGSSTIPVRVSILLIASAAFCTVTLAQSSSSSPSNGDKATLHKPTSVYAPEVKAFEQYIVYWTAEPGWRTELQLRNNRVSADLTVTPALRTAGGTETELSPLTIRPGEVVSLDLSDALVKAAPALIGSYGSVVLRYSSLAQRVLYAAAMVRMDGHPIAYHLDGSFRSDEPSAGSRSGIWWLPRNSVKDYLILTNYGSQKLDTVLELCDASGKTWSEPLSLAAEQTLRFSVRSLLQQAGWSGEYGGLKIEMAKNAARLGTAHVLFDEQGGFSALMKMFGYDPTATLHSRSFGGVKEWTTRAPMLALSVPDPALGFPVRTVLQPKIFVHNNSAKTYTAHLRFDWRSAADAGKTAPIDLVLSPDQTRLVDVAELQSQKLIPADAHWAAVVLSAPIQPDELMAVAASYDSTGPYGAQTPFNDQLAGKWEAGMWEVDATHDSLVTVGNGGSKPVRAELTILYNHGTEHYRLEQVLVPDEQMLVDFGTLIHNQIADSDGHTLPSGLMQGTYRVKDLTDPGLGNLYEGKVIVEKTYGHAAYGCAQCCGVNTPYMLYNPLGVPVESNATQTVAALNSCDPSLIEYVTSNFSGWSTANSAIATVNPGRTGERDQRGHNDAFCRRRARCG
jgi:hypothetical protein